MGADQLLPLNDCFSMLTSHSFETGDCLFLVHTGCPYYQIPCRKAASRDRQFMVAMDSYP
jgi:hypothetical protein